MTTPATETLTLVPVTLREARAFVDQHHRHHKAPQGGKFAVDGAANNRHADDLATSRDGARALQDGFTAEVTRLCVVGGRRNACSMLYRAAWRAARALGHRRLVTYTLASETGASLRGAGFRCLGQAGGGLLVPPVAATSRRASDAGQAAMGGGR